MLCQALNGRVCLVGLFAALLSPVVAIAGDAVDLKLKFPQGRRQHVELCADIHQSIKGAMIPGGQMDIKIKQVTGVMEKVESSSKDGAKVVLSYDRKAMTFEHPMMGNLHYDSDMPSEDEAPYIKQICAPYLGMSTTMELDSSSQVRSFSGMDAILKEISAEAAGNPFFSEMKSGVTNDAEKVTWGDNRWAVLPDHPVKPGDSWTCQNENDVPQLGKLVSDFNCKLERITNSNGHRAAVIAFTGKTTQPDGKDDAEPDSGMRLKLKGDGTFKGTTTFDVDAGQIINQTRETQMTLVMPTPDGGDSPAMQISLTSKETFVVKSPAEREKEKQEHLAQARAKKAEEEKAESKKPKADSE